MLRRFRDPSTGMVRYKMREKMIALGDDFNIEDAQGNKVFKVDGKPLRLRETFEIKDMQGHVLCSIQERMLRLRDTMSIDRDGQHLATVRKARIAPMRDRYSIDLAGQAPDMEAHGNFLGHEYTLEQSGQKIAEVSKRWLGLRDTYTVDVQPGHDDVLLLAITVCIDAME